VNPVVANARAQSFTAAMDWWYSERVDVPAKINVRRAVPRAPRTASVSWWRREKTDSTSRCRADVVDSGPILFGGGGGCDAKSSYNYNIVACRSEPNAAR